MRALAALALWLASLSAASAQAFIPCPFFTIGWAQSYSQPITTVLYDTSAQLLYVIWYNTRPSAFSNVPLSIMQGFSRTNNPVGYYNSLVLPSYHALLLAQSNNCPLLYEDGSYIWSD
jgi:KTSC domain-containing protein